MIKRQFSLFLKTLLLSLAAASLLADADKAAEPVQTKSRDPFWPLGFTPQEETRDAPEQTENLPVDVPEKPERVYSEEEWLEAEKGAGIRPPRYSLGVGVDGAAFILFKGRVRSEGELVKHKVKDVEFQWRIKKITSLQATFERAGAEIN